MKSPLLLLLLILPAAAAPSYGFGLQAMNSDVSTTTDYLFGMSLIADGSNIINIQSGATAAIDLPSDYTGRLTSGSVACSLTGWGDPFASTNPTPSCSISGNTIAITNLFTKAYALNYQFDFTLQVSSIRNPLASGVTGNFYFYLYATSGTISITATGVGISAATMTCSLTTSPTTINQNGYLQLQFLTPEFTTSSTLQIDFGYYWPQANPQSQQIVPDTAAVVCTAVANAGASIVCSFSSVGTSTFTGSISSLVSTNLTATAVTFQFGPVVTPPTTKTQGSFLVIAKTGGKTMSQCTVSASGMTAGTLTAPLLTPVTRTVNSVTDLSVQFTVNANIVATDTITVTFPSEISLSSFYQVYLPSTSFTVTSPTVNGQAITVSGGVAASNSSLTLTFMQIVNPPSELATSAFQISTARSGSTMDSLASSLTYAASRATIAAASLSASSLQIGVITSYTVQFTLGQPLTASSAIVVGLTTALQGTVTGCSPSPCTVNSIAVTFTNVATAVGASSSLSLTGAVNPLAIGTTNSLTLYTLYSSAQSNSFVEYINTGLTVDLVARIIPAGNIAVTSTSPVVSYSPASFSFTVTNANQLPANVNAKISIPPEVGVSASQVSCQAASTAVACSYDSATRTVTFSSISASTVAVGGLASLPLVVTNLVNPPTTTATSSFGVFLVNTLGQTVEYQTSGVTFACTQAASFYSLNLLANNSVNSAPTSLSVSFRITASSYTNSSLLVLTFPSLVNIQLANCLAVSGNLASVSCSSNANKLQALLLYSSLDTATATQFTLAPYTNYPSLQPFTLQVDLFASIGQTSKLNSDSVSFQNTGVGAITVASSSFSNPTLFSNTNLNFQIGAVSGLPFSYLMVSFPGEFGTASASCSLPSGLSCSLSGSSLNITASTSFSLPLTVAISNLVSPSISPSSNVYLQTFSSSGYLMDSSTAIYFQTSCTLPCKGCSSFSQPSVCTSCYSNSSLVSGQIYLNSSACVAVCSAGLFLDTPSNSCLLCTSPCATCASASACYSCVSSYFLLNSSCLSSCPFGYYGFNGHCLVCSSAIFC
jgi:hypothetical protein